LPIGDNFYPRRLLSTSVNHANGFRRCTVQLGYDGGSRSNLRRSDFTQSISRLTTRSQISAEPSGFYYARYRIQIDRVNYLASTDEHIKSVTGLPTQVITLSLDLLFHALNGFADWPKVLILDVCHSNPFAIISSTRLINGV